MTYVYNEETCPPNDDFSHTMQGYCCLTIEQRKPKIIG